MKILVTGAAGFIGCETALRLAARGDEVVGLDNLNAYYDPGLKRARLGRFAGFPNIRIVEGDIVDRDGMAALFAAERFDRVVHLAAQAGVRYGQTHPHAYADTNLTGFLNVLEGCRHGGAEHLVYASSSSVYGGNTAMPFSTAQATNHPLSLYAATKLANEAMAHSYAHLYRLPVTGLRFFTVYGPWGRPDMAPFLFTRKILAGEPIEVFNHGRHARDFTYVDDIATGILAALDRPAAPDPEWRGAAPAMASSDAPWRLYNIGGSQPTPLLDFIGAIEAATGRKAEMIMRSMQPGDVPATFAETEPLTRDTGWRATTTVAEGIPRFVAWFREFYRL
ncbi:NAD-dependent epimerase [Aureimonas endophytica]|uniref:NAD-dependent epimerase n=1 Tax=Aureimonas endophytica TaxID=2027858 RepID=A0A917ECK5_9HYPH|nr:NAD-dependent epimerase [Aureimonas endophytica]GGE23640.1 NAD-dependent epimerase [Aureimonas endophytica]